MAPPLTDSALQETPSFTPDTKRTLSRLRNAIRKVLAATPQNAGRAADVGRALKLDPALAWRIHALATQPEATLSAQSVPRPGSMERFLKAAEGVATADVARDVRSAYEAFEQVVSEHAGDRDTFDAMLTLQRPEDSTALRRVRRTAHRGNAAAWGAVCRCMIRTSIFRERKTGEIDSLNIVGHVGLQRLHAQAMVTIFASPLTWKAGPLRPEDSGRAAQNEHALIDNACSQPLPQIERAVMLNGLYRDIVVMDGLGKRSDTTIFSRSSMLAIPGATPEPRHTDSTTCRVPTELMVADFLVPRSWLVDPENASAFMTPDLGPAASHELLLKYRLPWEGNIQYLGAALGNLYCNSVPQYADIVQSELKGAGWDDTEFHIFRCEVQYPLLHSTLHMWLE